MVKNLLTWIALVIANLPLIASGEERHPLGNNLFWGGNLGLSFGDVNYVEVSPLVGKFFSPKFSAGGSLIYRHRRDKRYQQDITTNDYGGSLFGRYHLTQVVFAQAEYEHLQYEYFDYTFTKQRDSANSVFVGGGFNAPLSSNATFFAVTLYNLNHDESSPYDFPWVVRLGIGVGF